MKDEQTEKALECCSCMTKHGCAGCPEFRNKNDIYSCTIHVSKGALDYINRLKEEKYQLEQSLGQCENGYKLELHTTRMLQHRAETQLKELLSSLYRQTDNKEKSFVIYRNDIVELAKDCGIKEEELK